ncbi:MAG: UDP-N-acetylglucosamine 2-epimerase, partial [Planctomycetes bacterium]|nr:UDP-N-acetylglucosamine 2-epimerase [Planctomycetota bacterium]
VDAGLTAVCIKPNKDPCRGAILNVLQDFSSRFNWPILPTVDRPIFLQLIRCALALVGNSSSGMVESAAVDAVVLDIGDRQKGREHSPNVIHMPPTRSLIESAISRLQGEQGLADSLRSAKCVFGDGCAAERIASVLAEMDLSKTRRIKLNEY